MVFLISRLRKFLSSQDSNIVKWEGSRALNGWIQGLVSIVTDTCTLLVDLLGQKVTEAGRAHGLAITLSWAFAIYQGL